MHFQSMKIFFTHQNTWILKSSGQRKPTSTNTEFKNHHSALISSKTETHVHNLVSGAVRKKATREHNNVVIAIILAGQNRRCLPDDVIFVWLSMWTIILTFACQFARPSIESNLPREPRVSVSTGCQRVGAESRHGTIARQRDRPVSMYCP